MHFSTTTINQYINVILIFIKKSIEIFKKNRLVLALSIRGFEISVKRTTSRVRV